MPRRLRTWVGIIAIPLACVLAWYLLFGGRLDKSRVEVLTEFAVLVAVDVLLTLFFIRSSEGRFPWS